MLIYKNRKTGPPTEGKECLFILIVGCSSVHFRDYFQVISLIVLGVTFVLIPLQLYLKKIENTGFPFVKPVNTYCHAIW